MSKKVAIYIRVSTSHQIDKDSLPLQRNDLINYSKYALNIDNYEIFEDAGFSGKNTLRPAFQDMIKRIKQKEFSHLLVWKIDRISRNLIDFCEMYDDIKKYDCTFISKNEQFDTSSAMGEAMLKIILVFAELERKLTAERVSAVMIDRATKGLWNGAPVPLGYRWEKDNDFPQMDDSEAKTVKLIFDTYEKYNSTTVVARTLNVNDVKTKKDGKWTTKTIGDIIKNPFYKGTYRYNYKAGGRGKLKDESEWIIIDNNHAGIISEKQWGICNEIINENAKKNGAPFRTSTLTHVFSNLLECGECHKPYHGKNEKQRLDGYYPSFYSCSGRYRFYTCSQTTINDKVVGTFVLNFVSNLISYKSVSNDKLESHLLKNINSKDLIGISSKSLDDIINFEHESDDLVLEFNELKSDDHELVLLNKEVTKFKRALERLEDLFLFDEIEMSEKDYILKKKKISDKLNELNIKINDLSPSRSLDDDFIKSAKFLVTKLQLKSGDVNYENLTKSLGKDLVKDLVNSIIESITILNKHVISITFKNGLHVEFAYKKD